MGVIGHRGGTDCTCHPPGNPSVIGASGCPIHGMRALRLEVESLRRQHQGAVSTLKRIAGNEPEAALLARAELRRLGVPFADPATSRGQ